MSINFFFNHSFAVARILTGRSDNERREARGISDTQVNRDHGPPSVDRLSIHDERRSRKSSSVTSCSSVSTSPNHWLGSLGYYSRHHSMPAGRLARTASAPPPSVSAADEQLSTTTTDAEDDDAQSTFRSDGSTPEPPLSARPKNLNNHPKILKDQLHHSMASPFRPTRDVKFLNRSWTFAGR